MFLIFTIPTLGWSGVNLDTVASTNGSTTLSYVQTINLNSNRILVVGVWWGKGSSAAPVSGVSCGGQPLTLLVNVQNATIMTSSVWYLMNPPTGSVSINVTLTSLANIAVTSAAYYDVSAAPVAVTTTGNSTLAAVTITTSTVNAKLLHFVGATAAPAITTDAGWNQQISDATTGNPANSNINNYLADKDAPLPGSYASFDTLVTNSWVSAIVELHPTNATPTFTPTITETPPPGCTLASSAASTAGSFSTALLSFPHTSPAGLNRLLVVRLDSFNGSATSVKFNGIGLSLKRSDTTPAQTMDIWYLVDPPVATASVDIAIPAGSIHAAAVTFMGVDPISPFGGSNANFQVASSAPSITVTASAASNFLMTVLHWGTTSTTLGFNSGQSQLWNFQLGQQSNGDTFVLPAPGLQTLNYTLSGSSNISSQTIEIRAAACGSPTVSPSATPTATPTLTRSPSGTMTQSLSATPSRTETPSQTLSATPTATPSASPTPTASPSSSPTGSPSQTQTITLTSSPSPTHTPSSSPTASPTATATATPSASPSSSPSPSPTATSSATPSDSPTASLTQSMTLSPTLTGTLTQSATASLTSSVTATKTATPSATGTATRSATLTPIGSFTDSPTQSATSTISPTFTVSPTPAPVTLILRVYDSAGVLLYEISAGTIGTAVTDFSIDKPSWDPSLSPLLLTSPGWSFNYDGSGKNGPLSNGVYRLDIISQGSSTGLASKFVLVLRGPSTGVSALVWPNPAGPSQKKIQFAWAPFAKDVEASVYNNAGERVASLGMQHGGRGEWVLGSSADGIYFMLLRVPGDRRPQIVKIALTR